MGRRISKTVYDTSDLGTPTSDIRYLYDGWAMIREQSATTTNTYVYGIDLSGSMQGAGTIGGILSADLNGTTAFYCYDANGNVTDLVDTNGTSVAHYEYGPFGQTTAKTGTLADDNPFRFSTKYLDEQTGLYYYGYRYYNPELGRWINRDLIGEKGFELDRKPHATRSEQPQKGKCDRGGACGTGLLRDLEQSDKGISISVIPKDASLAYAFVFNNSIVGYDPYGLDCPGCDAVGGLPGMGSDCALRCCAKHDACYHDKGCTAASWGWIAGKLALCQIFGIPWYSCPLGYPVTNCDQCNIDVVKCLAGCLAGKDPGGPKYYCAKQGKYISIPGDFPDLNAAKNCCCN